MKKNEIFFGVLKKNILTYLLISIIWLACLFPIYPFSISLMAGIGYGTIILLFFYGISHLIFYQLSNGSIKPTTFIFWALVVIGKIALLLLIIYFIWLKDRERILLFLIGGFNAILSILGAWYLQKKQNLPQSS